MYRTLHEGGDLVELGQVQAEVGELVGFGRLEHHPASRPDAREGTEGCHPFAGACRQCAGKSVHLDEKHRTRVVTSRSQSAGARRDPWYHAKPLLVPGAPRRVTR